MATATQDDPLSTLLKKWIPYLPLPESTWLSSVAHNMVRKSGIVMATPRSMVDLGMLPRAARKNFSIARRFRLGLVFWSSDRSRSTMA
jgi:hypothetical protein